MTIYKNVVNDIRIYFNEQYYLFLERHEIDVKNNLVQLPLYPILLHQFLEETFDKELIDLFCPDNKMKVYFTIASFLQPRLMLNIFEINKDVVINQIRSDKLSSKVISKVGDFKVIQNSASTT